MKSGALSLFSINSLRGKINLIFTISFVLLVMLFVVLRQSSERYAMHELEMQERANIHYLYLYYMKHGRIDKDYLLSQNIRIVDMGGKNLSLRREIESRGASSRFTVANIKLHRYILINNDRFNLILENLNRPKFPIELTISFLGAMLLLLLLYIWIIRSINPLFELKREIIKFSEGNLDIDCKSDKRDEIADLANAFDDAVDKIKTLLRSRQLLLRAVMHELKTPIAKGRLLSEMIGEDCKKERFHTIFERLNLLIDEFARVEQVSSRNFDTDMRPYKMSDIVDASIDMLMLEEPKRYIHTVVKRDFTLQADFDLLTLAVKNLIDNGMKYGKEHKVDILIDTDGISFANIGEALKGEIEEYFLPFHDSQNGLGLGLYIVKSIADIHDLDFIYRYENGRVIFILSKKSGGDM
jgi:two-component system OmpR family sensor kinase